MLKVKTVYLKPVVCGAKKLAACLVEIRLAWPDAVILMPGRRAKFE